MLALMANDGIRAESAEIRAAASRRFAALMIQSFMAEPVPAPLATGGAASAHPRLTTLGVQQIGTGLQSARLLGDVAFDDLPGWTGDELVTADLTHLAPAR